MSYQDYELVQTKRVHFKRRLISPFLQRYFYAMGDYSTLSFMAGATVFSYLHSGLTLQQLVPPSQVS